MKKLLIAIALVVVTGIVAACLWFFPILKVGNVVISQRDQTSEADIAAITDGLQGQNILRVDTTAVASALSGLPWVAEARVAKKFPDTIDVSLVEHRAVLVAEREDGDHLIDANGKVFVVPTGWITRCQSRIPRGIIRRRFRRPRVLLRR